MRTPWLCYDIFKHNFYYYFITTYFFLKGPEDNPSIAELWSRQFQVALQTNTAPLEPEAKNITLNHKQFLCLADCI